MDAHPLRYLSAADVSSAMPDPDERLRLAERTLTALLADAQLPPKIGVYPRPADSFAHAMPAWMAGTAADGSADLLGLKWVAGFATNADLGLPSIHGTIILSDASSGLPRAVMDAGVITAQRTAAVSGVAIRHWGPPAGGAGARVAVIGAGAQARSHLPVVAHLRPGADLVLCDRDAARLEALAREAADASAPLGSFGRVRTTTDPIAAVDGASIVLTMVSFGPDRQMIPGEAFEPDATIVAVDYDMCVPAAVASGAGLFLTDDRGQFLATRTERVFAGYPDPHAMMGAAIRDARTRAGGRVLISHLGVGLADVVFADAILRTAEATGIGTIVDR